jgi:hypothetical protein
VQSISNPNFSRWSLEIKKVIAIGKGTKITLTPLVTKNKNPSKLYIQLSIPLVINDLNLEVISKLVKPTRILSEDSRKRILESVSKPELTATT